MLLVVFEVGVPAGLGVSVVLNDEIDGVVCWLLYLVDMEPGDLVAWLFKGTGIR